MKKYLIEKHSKTGKFISYEHIDAECKTDLKDKIKKFNKSSENGDYLAFVTAKTFSPSDFQKSPR